MKKIFPFLIVILLAGCSISPDTTTDGLDSSEEVVLKEMYTIEDIQLHGTKDDCRTAVDGNVYDVTLAFGKHPGGDEALSMVCGKDATDNFTKKHGDNPKPNNMLQSFIIGTIK